MCFICSLSQFQITKTRTLSPSSGISQETLNQSVGGGSSRANSLPRPISPSPSVASEKTETEIQVKAQNTNENFQLRGI